MWKSFVKKQFALAVRRIAGTVTRFSISEPIAALTFDDGPHPIYTPRVLDILEKFGIHATFFVLGNAARNHPELVQRIVYSGHTIGNHSWDHRSFPIISSKERRKQIRACERAIYPHGERIFRPPWGEQNIASCIDIWCLRYKSIGWSIDVGDWWDNDSQRMADLLAARIRPGSVILLHDSNLFNQVENQEIMCRANHDAMLIALDFFLERISQNFRFATIPEMFRLGYPIRRKKDNYRKTSGSYSANQNSA